MINSGLVCLAMLARYHGVAFEEDRIKHEMAKDQPHWSPIDLVMAARLLDLHAKIKRPLITRLNMLAVPAILQDKEENYFILGVARQKDGELRYLTQSPFEAMPQELNESQLNELWNGVAIVLTSKASLLGELAKFDFSWFIPAIVKYRRQLTEVLIVSIVLQLFALATPLFFQVVMDKVLLHNAINTLNVITIALVAVTVFEAALGYLRSYMFSHTSSRVDVELGARLFKHLVDLPIAYFEARRVGDSVARVRELENIREFLTGNAITLILDLVFSVIFIIVMFFYSTTLAWIVIGSIPCYFGLAYIVTPILRRQLDEKFNRGAENQAYLVESVAGVGTIKAMALEPQWIKRWEQQLAEYVKATVAANRTGIVANSAVSFLGKMVTIAITWMGAHEVIAGKMTIGELIAFNMLAGHVAQPIMRLAQMWSDFQQVGISMARLGDILNTRSEIIKSQTTIPRLRGKIEFDSVTFRYKPGSTEAIRNVNILINEGETVAIVGRSGSGKSTLTKLIQKLYHPEQGKITVDGFDLAMVDPASLRRQIGVVLQENILFNRSIRENIAVSDPAASMEKIIEAARKSGADEFVRALPQGYDTIIGENGTGLSGGQRQRIAIARALLSDPRILILDEATSALDYESERVVQDNMDQIRKNRTLVIVAHRLSAIRLADRIYVMERGQIIEHGTHQSLVTIPGGFYANLVRMQMG